MSVNKFIFFALVSAISINVEAATLINPEETPVEELTVMPRLVPQYSLSEIYGFCGFDMADIITNINIDIDKHLIEAKDVLGEAHFVLPEGYLIFLHKGIAAYQKEIQARLDYLQSVKDQFKDSPYAQEAFDEAKEACFVAMGEFIKIRERYPIYF